jgi:hypothetical protein
MRWWCSGSALAFMMVFVGCNKPTVKPAADSQEKEEELRHYSEEYIDATKYHYRNEMIEVRIVGTEITGPRSQAIMNPNDVRYLVRLKIRNISDRAKLDYEPYGLFDVQPASTLFDGFNNKYKMMAIKKGSWFGGLGEKKALYPGSEVEDVLAFETPVQKADKLHLTLPGSAMGVGGDIKFHVPATGFSAKQFDPTYHATITRMEYRQAEERKHEQRILQEKIRQAEQARLKMEAEKKQAEEEIAKTKKLNDERERADAARMEQQKTEAEYKLTQEKAKANEKLRQEEAAREAKKKAELEAAEAEAAQRIIQVPRNTIVPIGTSKFVVAESIKSVTIQDQMVKTGDLVILTADAEVSLVKAGLDYSEVMYKTKKYYVATKYLITKSR